MLTDASATHVHVNVLYLIEHNKYLPAEKFASSVCVACDCTTVIPLLHFTAQCRITGNFGGSFNLAICRLKSLSSNFKFASNIYYPTVSQRMMYAHMNTCTCAHACSVAERENKQWHCTDFSAKKNSWLSLRCQCVRPLLFLHVHVADKLFVDHWSPNVSENIMATDTAANFIHFHLI